jgi:hypothetical protein
MKGDSRIAAIVSALQVHVWRTHEPSLSPYREQPPKTGVAQSGSATTLCTL